MLHLKFVDWHIEAQAIRVAFRVQRILLAHPGPEIGRLDVAQPALVCKYSHADRLGGLENWRELEMLAKKESCLTSQPT